jgi:DNA repair exonuclease SbcCD nuclease subunit
MAPFSFIHASDLHLGSPFKGVSDLQPEVSALLQAATFDAFDALIALCLEKSAAFLLVAGDIFDTANRSLRAQLTFRDGLARLAEAGIPSFVVFGNHDPWEAWSAKIHWPKGVHVFGPDRVETVHVPIDGKPTVAVSGISFRTQREPRRLVDLFISEDTDLFQVAMLHSNCGGQPGHDPYAPCRVVDLQRAGFDYWALGHVHEKKVLGVEPHIVYPGSIQGLHIKESKPHGCYHVTVSNPKDLTLTFCPLDRVRWQTISVAIDGHESLDGLDQEILATLEDLHHESADRPVICRISLDGRGPLYQTLHQQGAGEEILERLRVFGLSQTPPLWIQKLQIDCLPEMDLVERMEVDDLLGQLLKTAEAMRQEKDPALIAGALGKVYNHRRFKRYLKIAPEQDKLLRDVQLLCIDLLESGS